MGAVIIGVGLVLAVVGAGLGLIGQGTLAQPSGVALVVAGAVGFVGGLLLVALGFVHRVLVTIADRLDGVVHVEGEDLYEAEAQIAARQGEYRREFISGGDFAAPAAAAVDEVVVPAVAAPAMTPRPVEPPVVAAPTPVAPPLPVAQPAPASVELPPVPDYVSEATVEEVVEETSSGLPSWFRRKRAPEPELEPESAEVKEAEIEIPMFDLGDLTAPEPASSPVPPAPAVPPVREPLFREPPRDLPPLPPRASEPRFSEPRTPDIRLPEFRMPEPRATEPRTTEPRFVEPRMPDLRTADLRPSEPYPAEPRPPLPPRAPKPVEPRLPEFAGLESKPQEPKQSEPRLPEFKPLEPRVHVPSRLQESLRPTPSRPFESETARPPVPPVSEPLPPEPEAPSFLSASDLVEEPASEPAATVIKAGVIGGMAYKLYSDGSIEADLPDGTLRFASLQELRDHVASAVRGEG